MNATLIFDIQELYYLAQYIPVYRELKKRGAECTFVIYENKDFNELLKEVIQTEGIPSVWVKNEHQALSFYLKQKANWVIFGNHFFDIDSLHLVSKSAQFGHGVGPKMSYYTKSSTQMNVRFVEGKRRLDILNAMYPEGCFIQTGFAKLDPLFNNEIKPFDLEKVGLDPNKKTILYAPTFYPSSLPCFSDKWPREFIDYNLIVKPHFFSLSKSKYKLQRNKIEKWAQEKNVYVAKMSEHSLLPFMATADLLISEASSALFEFAALDKPIVWCDFLKLRWTYRGPLKFRFTKRMDQDILNFTDLGAHAASYKELKRVVESQLMNTEEFFSKRKKYTEQLVGATDGKASVRIADYLLMNR
ncbi:CDP-glycerol glycerophosphotransferase family protein [Psychromonas sp. PT13]|uniref:CDP-glycerol glycerophosphotransferase family protein n=1 Tax=Psychromonas sp. PT13 TaxID=3439547 RepID=UPI003EBD2AD8